MCVQKSHNFSHLKNVSMPFFYVFFFNLDLGQLSSHIYTSSRENGPGTLAELTPAL